MGIRRVVLNHSNSATAYAFLIACQFIAPNTVFAQQDRVSGAPESPLVALAGNRSYQAKLENDRGLLDPSRVIGGMSLVFRRSASQTADLAKLLEEQRDPNSPHYHAWLTQDQYADRFGLTPA